MTLVSGIFLFALAVAFFVFSLPRGGKLARFIDTSWETPLVLGMVASLFVGLVLVIAGWSQLGEVIQ